MVTYHTPCAASAPPNCGRGTERRKAMVTVVQLHDMHNNRRVAGGQNAERQW